MVFFHRIIWPALSHSAGLQFTSSDISLMQVLVGQCHLELCLFWNLVDIPVGLPREKHFWTDCWELVLECVYFAPRPAALWAETWVFKNKRHLSWETTRQNTRGCRPQSCCSFRQVSIYGIIKRVCTSTLCFGWIVIHSTFGFWQKSNTAVDLQI